MHVQRVAMTAVVIDGGYVIGVCREDHPGWSKHPDEPIFDDFVECQDRANTLNTENGVTMREALVLVSNAMVLLADAKAAGT